MAKSLKLDINEIRKHSKAEMDLVSLREQIELELSILTQHATAKGTSDELVNICRKLERIRDTLRPLAKHFRMKTE